MKVEQDYAEDTTQVSKRVKVGGYGWRNEKISQRMVYKDKDGGHHHAWAQSSEMSRKKRKAARADKHIVYEKIRQLIDNGRKLEGTIALDTDGACLADSVIERLRSELMALPVESNISL